MRRFLCQGFLFWRGGDFSAEEAAYCGPLEVAVVFDPKALKKAGVGTSDHVFSRIACELVDALGNLNRQGTIFELVAYRSSDGRKVNPGKDSFALTTDEIRTLLKEQATPFDKAWFAGARVVAGDRSAGGEFVETIGAVVWKDGLNAEEIKDAASVAQDQNSHAGPVRRNPFHDAHWRLVQTCRLALGQHHEDFRTGSARSVFDAAGPDGCHGHTDGRAFGVKL